MTAITYPGAISRACAALDEIAEFRAMPDGYLRVLIRIVKKINLATFSAPIRASRTTLATESGKSVETVGRVIRWLEDAELIQRQQKARPGLRGSESPIIPTKKLLTALQLTGQPVVDKPTPLPVRADGSKSLPQSSPIGKQPGEPGPFVRIEGKTVPTDLVQLCQQGIQATGVLALMREAKTAGKRLSDVVQATQKYLVGLEGRALYAYIRKLIGKDRDYGRQVSEEAKAQQADQARTRLQEKAEALLGRKFQNAAGTMQIEVVSNGFLAINDRGRGYSCKLDEAFLDALESGRVRPISADQSDYC